MRVLVFGFGLILLFPAAAGSIAHAQPWCAMYDDGTPPNCGIPTFQSCEQSISGAGGSCVPDVGQQRAPGLRDGFRPQQFGPSAAPSGQGGPNDPNWVPPPPGQ
jgi:hypothetical protein